MTPTISFEFPPPAPGQAEARFRDTVERLAPLEPAFLSLTFGAGGTTQSRSDRILRALLARGQVDAAGYSTCVGTTRAEVDAGADRALTQYFFDAELFLRFREHAAKAGIEASIVPGILPITDFAKIRAFSERRGAAIPNWLAERFEGLDEDPETRAMVAATTACELCRRMFGAQPALDDAA